MKTSINNSKTIINAELVYKRQKALDWWKNQDKSTKQLFITKYYPDRNIDSLTGREIQLIFVQEAV